MAHLTTNRPGIEYSRGVPGKYLFRIRETYVAGPLAEMVRSRRVGAVKLDLILRGLALLPEHTGEREPGVVPRHRGQLSYQVLHDLCRDPSQFRIEAPHDAEDDSTVLEKKRSWVREQLQVLEGHQLVQRVPDNRGRRPEIVVLSDKSDGSAFDDPGAQTQSDGGYVTISGAVISAAHFRDWGAPEVVGYVCAMTADRFARHRHKQRTGEELEIGAATWFRQADWFNNKNPNFERPDGHVAYPFSTTTIERGLRSLCNQGLIHGHRTISHPESGQRFNSGSRKVYENQFATFRNAEIIDLASYRSAS